MNTIKYIGIDVHQATSVFAIRDSRGNMLGESVLKTEPTTIVDFLKGQRGTIRVTFEEGTYASWLYDVIKPHVSKVIVCDPRKNKLDENKTDRIDARKLAELLRLNALSAVYHGEQSNQTLKEYARSYLSLQQDSTRIMNRLKAMYRGRGIGCRGVAIYRPKNRREWLDKLKNTGAQCRAERLLKQLEFFGASVGCAKRPGPRKSQTKGLQDPKGDTRVGTDSNSIDHGICDNAASFSKQATVLDIHRIFRCAAWKL